MSTGTVLCAEDQGTIWRLVYRRGAGLLDDVIFDHRCFANFYEAVTGRDFLTDYAFGRGRAYVSRQLAGLRISVDGGRFNETVRLED